MAAGIQDPFAADIPALLQRHLEQLTQGSGLPLDIIRERGYRSILGKQQLVEVGFAPTQYRQLPGLLLPVCPPDGSHSLSCYRPDVPRTTRGGKELKYELPRGTTARLDVPPRCRPLLVDPSAPVWVTEGQKKADALAAQGLCALALLGVWNFKGRNAFGGVVLLADFDYIAWNSRDVRLVFDSDLMTKATVRDALARLTEHLQRKGAQVTAVYLPAGSNGSKVGVDDYLLAHSLAELEALVESPRPQPKPAPALIELLDEGPPQMRRPLALVQGRAYAATWLHVKVTRSEGVDKQGNVVKLATPDVTTEQRLFIVRDDGVIFGDEDVPMNTLGMEVHLPEMPPPSRLWSARGVKAYRAGQRPNPVEVFRLVVAVVNGFMDFQRSLAPQTTMCELVACYIFATYLLEAFTVIGYLWPNGEKGSGKTHLLILVAELAYLGQVILAGGTYASLRDLADYGATLAFDDCEHIMDARRSDPDKRALLLAGNRRGATIPFKEPTGTRGWITRYVQTFCPRLFSAIRLPDDVLARRTITIPLVRSADPVRAKIDPLDPEVWPCDRHRLLDDLWALALQVLPTIRDYDQRAAQQARLSGADLDPWRAILAVALWLQTEHKEKDLFTRMEALSVAYQKERGDLEATDPTRLLVLALQEILQRNGMSGISACEFETGELVEAINRRAQDNELAEAAEAFTNAKRVGRLLRRLRFEKATPGKTKRRWKTTPAEVEALAHAYGMAAFASIPPHSSPQNAENAKNAETPTPNLKEDSAFLHEKRFRHFSGEMPEDEATEEGILT